jgi:heterotetrameric sarcosine oxidase gamma subunit
MLECRSALAAATHYKSDVLEIGEHPGFTLTQVAGLDDAFETGLAVRVGRLPAKVGIAEQNEHRTIMRIGPAQFWIIGPETDDLVVNLQGGLAVTPLSHSRTRIFIDGTPAREVLAKCMPLDFHAGIFTPGTFAMTGLHHTPVTVHCLNENRFDLYVLRTFAMSAWEWLTDAALEFAQ